MKDVLKQIALLAGILALDRFAKTGKLLAGLADDSFDGSGDLTSDLPQDITVPYQYGAPYIDPTAYGQYSGQYGSQPYQPYSPYSGGYPYQQPYSPYSPYGSGYPYQQPYQQPYSPYGSGYPYSSPGAAYQSAYPSPVTTYPPIQTGYPYTSGYPTAPTQIMNTAEATKDGYVTQGVQQGILQVSFCGTAISGQSQYHNCNFTYVNSKGARKTANFANAANVMKRYYNTGRIQ